MSGKDSSIFTRGGRPRRRERHEGCSTAATLGHDMLLLTPDAATCELYYCAAKQQPVSPTRGYCCVASQQTVNPNAARKQTCIHALNLVVGASLQLSCTTKKCLHIMPHISFLQAYALSRACKQTLYLHANED
jgi:hypothetical protein